MVDTRTDYPEHAVEAARSVMLEMVRLLGDYRDDIVIIGGWVPELLLTESEVRHFGSIDVDLALNHNRVSEAAYRTIRDLLISHGYKEGQQPFIFLRTVEVQGRAVTVHVDFLAGEYGGTSQGHRTQSVQDIAARKARGCDLAFEMNQPVKIEGRLPDGGKDSAEVRVASVVPFMVMKGMALSNRLKPKDAWDILFFVEHYPGGMDALVEEIMPHVEHGLVREGMAKIREKFLSPEHVGPRFVADFEEIEDRKARADRQRAAFEKVNFVLERLGFTKASGLP